MWHKGRRWSVINIETPDELAERLTRSDHQQCVGFRLKHLLFLNDSQSGSTQKEFAVIRDSDKVQVASILFGWCDEQTALEYIHESLTGENHSTIERKPQKLTLEDPKTHSCPYCEKETIDAY